MFDGRWLRILCFWSAAICSAGCELFTSPPDAPGIDPANDRLSWVQPSPGDIISGTLLLEASIEIQEPITSLTFLIDGSTWETLYEPPWASEWPDAEAGFHELEFLVEGARTGAHYSGRSIEIEVEYPARFYISTPTGTPWQRVSSLDSLSLSACSVVPDLESPLLWRVGRQHWQGQSFPLDHLSAGKHLVSVRGRHSVGRFEATREIEILGDELSGSPEQLWSHLLGALRTRDQSAIERRMALDLVFSPCEQELGIFPAEATKGRGELTDRLRSFWDHHSEPIGWSGTIRELYVWPPDSPTFAWIEIDSLRIFPNPLGVCSDGATELMAEEVRVQLRARSEDGVWQVTHWTNRGS